MELFTRYIPYGDLPYTDIRLVTRMMARLYENCPYLAMLPNITEKDSIEYLTLQKMPGLTLEKGKVVIKAGTEQYENTLMLLDKAFNNPTVKNLIPFSPSASFLQQFLQVVKKFESKHACVNLLGPFTISQMLKKAEEDQMLADKSYKKLFIQAVCVRALWFIEIIKAYSPKTVPIIMLEEPALGSLGVVRKNNEDITNEVVINLLAKVISKLKSAGAIVGIQCFEKCDWTVPIDAGADIISFDAYNNPNNLHIVKGAITDYLSNGGWINWASVPVISEDNIKTANAENLSNRLFKTIDKLFLEGVPYDLLYKSATVSLNAGTKDIPAMFAEKIHMTLHHVANRLTAKSSAGNQDEE